MAEAERAETHTETRDGPLDAEHVARRRLALAQIRQYGDPVLRMRAQEIEEFDDDLRRLAERMTALMKDASGVGLAGNQAGVLRRIVVMQPDAEQDAFALINPEIVAKGDERETDEEGCLSLAGVLAPVERALWVKVEGRDVEGNELSMELEGLGGARGAARDRPPRRDPHPRPHDEGGAPRGARPSAAAARPRPLVARIGVAATAPLGADVLERLAANHDVAFLLTRPDRPRGRGRQVGAPPAKEVAERLGIPVRQPERLDASFEVDVPTMVVAAYGALIPTVLLERALWLNVHPSLLPRWRGAAPVERALIAGDTETGVTIHRTTPELDAGPIAAQEAFPVGPDDDAGTVYARAGELAAELLERVLAAPEFRDQPHEGATYAEKITAADRELDWSREDVLNWIRALSPHIGARTEVNEVPLTVWRARPAAEGSALVVDGVELLEVQPDGRKRMTGAEFLRGYARRP